jgi:hypothetical protein
MESMTSQPPAESKLRLISSLVPQLRAMASELFGSATVDFETDPEIPDAHYIVFRVRASGDIPEIAARRLEWYRRTQPLLQENADLVRLDIDAQ